MPQLPPVSDVTRVVYNFLWNGERCANVVHYKNIDGAGAPDADRLGAAIRSSYDVFGDPYAANTCSLTSLTITPLDELGGLSREYTTSMPIVGTNVGPSLPNNVSVVTTFNTGIRGRSYRGRAYWNGLTESMVVANTLDSSPLAGINAFWENVRIEEPSTGEPIYQMCVVSYVSGGVLRAVPLATPITSVNTNATLDSQRRRLPGR
jgi:hypothetical protein